MITAVLGTIAKTQNHLSVEGLLDGYQQGGTHGAVLPSREGEETMPHRATGEKAETVPPRGTVHGVAHSQTRLKQLSSSSSRMEIKMSHFMF